jgi:hypothetical protein
MFGRKITEKFLGNVEEWGPIDTVSATYKYTRRGLTATP